MALGDAKSPNYANKAGRIIGSELSALGINVNFAPVFDTNNNPLNPVIGLRSYSSKPNLVAKLGVEEMKGMQAYNIAVAAKHFPGRGILKLSEDTRTFEERLTEAESIVGSSENRAVEREIAEAAVTVVKNQGNTLPMKPQEGEKVLLLAAYNNEVPGMELGMRRLIVPIM